MGALQSEMACAPVLCVCTVATEGGCPRGCPHRTRARDASTRLVLVFQSFSSSFYFLYKARLFSPLASLVVVVIHTLKR
jgi:hypothetical protein